MAVRGDLLCLTRGHARRSDSGFGTDILNVLEINAADLAVRDARFVAEDLNAAHDCLNQWWTEGLPPELAAVASPGFRVNDLIEDGDSTALDKLLRNDFVLIDHRSMRSDQLDRNEAVDMWLTRQEATPGFTILVRSVERLTQEAMLTTVTAVMPDGFETELIPIQVIKDGLLVYLEQFDTHDLTKALARFDELTSTSPS